MLLNFIHSSVRRPALVALLAGSAVAATAGCAVTEELTQNEPAPATTITPRSETFYASARTEGVTIQDAPRQPHAMIDTSALADTGEFGGLQANTWADLGDGWSMVSAASTAEQPHPVDPAPGRRFQNLENDGTLFTHDPFASRVSRSGDATSDLYDNVLGGALPREANVADQGKNTENVRQVTFTAFGADFDPMTSRDGKQVIFASTQHRETADIYIKNVNSRVVTRLTSDPAQDVMPSISPDGKFIAFCSNRMGTWDIYMMPTLGGKPVQLTSDNTHDLHPSWSPDGTKIVFSRLGQSSGRWELWVMDIQNAGTLQFIGYGLFPQWNPVTGTGMGGADQIVYQRSRERGDRAFSIWTIDYSDQPGAAIRETEIVASATDALINPSWSPDGEFILYASVPNNESWQAGPTGAPTQTALWMIGNDGRGRVNLVSGSTINLMPVWGSDDNVYFVSNRSGVENLWAINVGEAVMTANAQRPGHHTSTTNTGFATAPTGPNGYDGN